MARSATYNNRLKQAYSLLNKLAKMNETLLNKMEKRQKTINRSLPAKKQLKHSPRPHTKQVHDKLTKINRENTKRGRFIKTQRNKLRKIKNQIHLQKHNISTPHYARLSKKDNNGYFIRYRLHPITDYIISDETIQHLLDIIQLKRNDAISSLKDGRRNHRLKINDKTVKNMRLIFSDKYGDFGKSVNVRTLDEAREKLITEMNTHNATSKNDDEDMPSQGERFLKAVDFFIFNSPTKVGCASNLKKKYVFNLSQNELIHLYCPKSSKNRCFCTCLIKGISICSSKRAFDVQRKLKIDNGAKIDPKSHDAHAIADSLGVAYIVYHGIPKANRIDGDSIGKSFKVYCQYKTDERDKIIQLIKIAGHCYLIKDKHVYKRKCNKCGDVRKTGIAKNHKCKAERISFFQNHICEQNSVRCSKLRIEKERNWVIFDLETLPCGAGETHMVYAVGWYDYDKQKYHSTYGKNAMNQFMQWIHEHGQNKTYMAYNGSRFDFYFLQKEILKTGVTPQFLMNNGRILSLKWGGESFEKHGKTYYKNQNSVWDLCNFLVGFSLKKACEAFGTKNQKQDFDHARMHDWNCVYDETNKKDCLHYLYYDVMSLVELTDKYISASEDEYLASPTKYLTLSSFAENVWKSGLEDIVEVPDMEKQSFIGKSVYGGRTYPCRKRFESKMYKTIMSHKSNARKLKNIYKLLLKSGDYIFNGDINSQYPACMAGCELMPTLFPTGFSTWIDNPTECQQIFHDNKQLGIFEIEFSCPNKKLRHAILPRKKIVERKNGKQVFTGVEWSLTDGRGTYNSVDIQNAIKHGYKIKFIGRGLVWESVSDNVFKSYVDTVYAKKVEASISGNKVKRQVAKLMMNSLYGKTLQNPISKNECLAKNAEQVESFLAHHVLTDWQIVENSDGDVDYLILTGEKIHDDLIAKKPRHLGSLVLGYSRRLWLHFLETIDPTVQAEITTYLDTDSLHISGKHFDKLKQAGVINDDKLGFLSNDCKDNALIIKEINLSPKCYMYEALTQSGQVKTTMKSKGIMQKKTIEVEHTETITDDSGKITEIKKYTSREVPVLKKQWYELAQPQPANWTGMKKVNKRVCKSDKLAGVEHFTVKKQDYKRTFHKQEWQGMSQVDGYFYPFGYQLN